MDTGSSATSDHSHHERQLRRPALGRDRHVERDGERQDHYHAFTPRWVMAGEFDPEFALFVGGFVALLFLLGAAAAYLTVPGNSILGGLAVALAGLGIAFFLLGALIAGLLWLLSS